MNDPFNDPIIVQDTRILRPKEYEILKSGIPKNYYKTVFDALLCSGMRYSEFLEFQKHPKWFNAHEKKIYLPAIAVRKKKVKRKQRWIKLSNYGSQIIDSFFNGDQRAPDRRTWYDNLRRWSKLSGMDTTGINIKTTRKTWESWLLEYYGAERGANNVTQILLSQGHTQETAINHYLSLAFTSEDRNAMTYLLAGWM